MQRTIITIPMVDWVVSTRARQIGFSGENGVVLLKIETEPESDVTYYLDVKSKRDAGTIPLRAEADGLVAELTEQMLGGSGEKKMQLVGFQGYQKRKSNIFSAVVGESINATEEFEKDYQSVLTKLTNEVRSKQDVLIAGEGMSIEDNVISVSYPDGDEERY